MLDKCAGILYNKDRSEEERKTLGPTADLPFFKLYASMCTTYCCPDSLYACDRTTCGKLYVQKFFRKKSKKAKKSVDKRAGIGYNDYRKNEGGTSR